MIEPDAPAFGVNRFEIRRRLGSGGFGEVYEAFDHDRREVVALKVLRRTDPSALYRFKQEFRTLANLSHRNLVNLHELISAGEEWLLTMELVRGVNLAEYVRPVPADRVAAESTTPGPADVTVAPAAVETVLTPSDASGPRHPAVSVPLPLGSLRIDRLRSSLKELAEGVMALHQNGILHLDIKPSNVLVSDDGRVVLVDFGLAEEFGLRGRRPEQGQQVFGTPEYMSPEQAAAQPLSEASDWYCVGALLYRALTGLPAFSGRVSEVLIQKIDHEPTPPIELVDGIPEDLDALCRDLLRRDPRRRPKGPEVLARLGAMASSVPEVAPAGAPAGRVFVGRAPQLADLGAAFDDMKQGRGATVHVVGRSGMGKSSLVRTFLTGLRASHPDVIVLEGRCYEHEAVPFKAFDALLDALCNHLRGLSDSQVALLLPRGVEGLARIFPSLLRVPAIAATEGRTRGVVDPSEQRRRAFAALRDFFGRVAERHPLVLFIDDLQWGDVDSAVLLEELLRPPDPPPLLLIASYRADERETSACLRALLSADSSRGAGIPVRRVEVAELNHDEAEQLASALLPAAAPSVRAGMIANETQGNPFFIDQLARHSRGDGADEETLEAVLWNRAAQLPDLPRRFMEVIAVAGSPVDISVAAGAAGVESGKYEVFASLRAARLVRSRARRGRTEVEPYHDRIRETIVARLTPDVRKGHHGRLAIELESSSSADPEVLTLHFRAGGYPEKAARYAIEAARQSTGALAFDGAARLYSLAIELQPGSPDVPDLRIKLADALAMTGRVIESAESYLAAATSSSLSERVELQRRAGEQYLLGFHLEKGLALLRSLLAEMGMTLPATATGAFIALVARRWYLRMRGTAFRERPETQVPVADLQRLDLCHIVCRGLGFTDSVRAIELQTRHLALALRVGEPYRVARALTLSAAADGLNDRGRPRAQRLLKQAREIAERVDSPQAIGIVHSATGLIKLGEGRWLEARREFEQAETTFREKCIVPPHTTMLCHLYRLDSLYNAGALREYFRLIPECVAECQGRGDVHAETHLRMRQAHLKCFADDDPQAGLEELRNTEASLGGQKLLLARVYLLFRQVELSLYAGAAGAAWDLITRGWIRILPMRIVGFQALSTMAFERRAYAALGMAAASAATEGSRRSFLRSAEADAHRIDKWRAPFGTPIAQLIRAGVAAQRDQPEMAGQHLVAAERGFESADMALHRAVARWQRGTLIGGDAGRALVRDSVEWMTEQGVRNTDGLIGVIAPGRWSRA